MLVIYDLRSALAAYLIASLAVVRLFPSSITRELECPGNHQRAEVSWKSSKGGSVLEIIEGQILLFHPVFRYRIAERGWNGERGWLEPGQVGQTSFREVHKVDRDPICARCYEQNEFIQGDRIKDTMLLDFSSVSR